jgi:two-component system LytT family sensor kinase
VAGTKATIAGAKREGGAGHFAAALCGSRVVHSRAMNARESSAPPSLFRARTLALVLAAWTVYGVLLANHVFWVRRMNGLPEIPFRHLLEYQLPEAWLWALLTVPVLFLARRFPVTATTALRRVPLHLAFAVLVHLVGVVVLYLAHPFVRRGGPRLEMPTGLLAGLFFDVFIYAAIVATVHAVTAQGQALRLRNELLEAELRMLRMQLQPHFLFNTLNAVSELIHRDPGRAERAVARLGDLLRWSLQSSSLKEVTLREELNALDLYLDIQRLRHGDGLHLRVAADPAALDLAVPSLLLQPLVENAIRHGVRGAPAGTVTVEARQVDGRLRLAVADDGRGLDAGFREGTGLRATRARLDGLYGEDQEMRLGAGENGGTRVEVTIPARRAGLAEGAA